MQFKFLKTLVPPAGSPLQTRPGASAGREAASAAAGGAATGRGAAAAGAPPPAASAISPQAAGRMRNSFRQEVGGRVNIKTPSFQAPGWPGPRFHSPARDMPVSSGSDLLSLSLGHMAQGR